MAEGVEFSGGVLNDFAVGLFKNSGAATESVCVSPASVALALAMVFYGSVGKTKSQIHEALFGTHLKDEEVKPYLKGLVSALNEADESVVTHIANRLYSDTKYNILQSYSAAIENDLHGSIVSVNFTDVVSAVDEINGWVEKSSKGKIKAIVSEGTLDRTTRLMALNAIYFKSQWMKIFPKEFTKKEAFYSSPGKTTEVDMMTQNDSFLYGETDGCQILTLKYVGNSVGMTILLPKNKFGLEKLEKSLTGEKLKDLLRRSQQLNVTVKLPKFKLHADVSLKDTLQRMNITDMFRHDADLSGISGRQDLYVSDAKHKSIIEVDEKGTEAAAVTGIEAVAISLVIQEEPVFFIADHPFMFVLENFWNDLILFVGRYAG